MDDINQNLLFNLDFNDENENDNHDNRDNHHSTNNNGGMQDIEMG